MSVLIKQNDSSGNNADLFVAGRSVFTKGDVNEMVEQKLFTTAHDIDTNKTERKISISKGIPTYKGSVSDAAFSGNGVSISQGDDETSGFYFDGDCLKFWCPFDTPSDEQGDSIKSKGAVVFYDEDNGTKMFKITIDGMAWSKTLTTKNCEDNILTTKNYTDNSAVPNTGGMTSQSWSSGSTYVAPGNGWVYLYRSGSMSGSTGSQTYFYVRVNSTGSSLYRYQFAYGNSQVSNATIMCPVAKGDQLYFYYSNSSYAPNYKYFVPNKNGS